MTMINRKSSARKIISLPETWPTLVSGERSIEKIIRQKPILGLIRVKITITAPTTIRKEGEEKLAGKELTKKTIVISAAIETTIKNKIFFSLLYGKGT
ncbi:MAG: hypothetical protein ABIG92_00300 [Candidatus Omnitrophota bacterium]